jgi:hypothetical protein
MSDFYESQQFAARLRFLKLRTQGSYAALAQRVGVSKRFGRVCGADRQELLNLHHLWLAAVARRDRPRTTAAPPVEHVVEHVVDRQPTRRTLYLFCTAVATGTVAVLSRWTSRLRRRHA